MFNFKFDWDPSINIGIPNIDEQHQELFSIAREIEQLVLTHCLSATEADYYRLLCKLREYVTYHFYEEEALMQAIKYPDYENHKAAHDTLKKAINSIDCNYLCNQPFECFSEIKSVIKDWVFQHMLIDDTAIGKFYNA